MIHDPILNNLTIMPEIDKYKRLKYSYTEDEKFHNAERLCWCLCMMDKKLTHFWNYRLTFERPPYSNLERCEDFMKDVLP